MNQAIKAYFFIPSGFRNYIENGFEGWGSFFFLYLAFGALFSYEAATNLKSGIYIFLITFALLFVLAILSTAGAFVLGAKEPLIRAMRLTGLCLPLIGLTIYFIARKSLLSYFGIYPIIIFIYGSAFLKPDKKILNALVGMVTIALTLGLTFLFSMTSDKWFGQQLAFDGYKAELTAIPIFKGNEAKVYRHLLLETPRLGHIPQADEIADSLKIDRARVQNALLKLDDMGCIVLGADREIRYAYPWALYYQGYKVLIDDNKGNPLSEPIYAASALHALSVAALFKDSKITIFSHLSDNGDAIFIKLSKGQIDTTNHPEAQVYKSDIFSEIEFYSSPASAKASYRGRFESTRLLSLDRAVMVASDMIRDKTQGLF